MNPKFTQQARFQKLRREGFATGIDLFSEVCARYRLLFWMGSLRGSCRAVGTTDPHSCTSCYEAVDEALMGFASALSLVQEETCVQAAAGPPTVRHLHPASSLGPGSWVYCVLLSSCQSVLGNRTPLGLIPTLSVEA